MNRFVIVALVSCLSLIGRPLGAQPTGAERALAEKLFDEGRELMMKDRYAEACPKLEESQRIDPAGGTLLNLALCHERLGKTASAWSEFREALANARRDGRSDREEIALEHSKSLEVVLPKLRIVVRETSSALELLVDGVALGAEARRGPIPLDPGDHFIEARATGKSTFQTRVSIAAGETKELEIPALEAAPTPEPSLSVAPVSTPRPVSTPLDVKRPSVGSDGNGQRTVGYVSLGLGVAGLVVGGVFGLDALSEDRASDRRCKKDGCSDPTGVSHSEKARRSALVSDVAFAAGGIALGAGVYLVLSAPSGAEENATSARGGTVPRFGASLSGTW